MEKKLWSTKLRGPPFARGSRDANLVVGEGGGDRFGGGHTPHRSGAGSSSAWCRPTCRLSGRKAALLFLFWRKAAFLLFSFGRKAALLFGRKAAELLTFLSLSFIRREAAKLFLSLLLLLLLLLFLFLFLILILFFLRRNEAADVFCPRCTEAAGSLSHFHLSLVSGAVVTTCEGRRNGSEKTSSGVGWHLLWSAAACFLFSDA